MQTETETTIPTPTPAPALSLTQYALVVTFRIASPTRNRKSATCRGCGSHLSKGEGREVRVQLRVVGRTAPYYLCPECFSEVMAAHEADMEIQAQGVGGDRKVLLRWRGLNREMGVS